MSDVLDRLDELYAKATKGEWAAPSANLFRVHAWDSPPTVAGAPTRRPEPVRCICEVVDSTGYGAITLTWPEGSLEPAANMAWIAAAHNAYPALRAELLAARRVVEAAKAVSMALASSEAEVERLRGAVNHMLSVYQQGDGEAGDVRMSADDAAMLRAALSPRDKGGER